MHTENDTAGRPRWMARTLILASAPLLGLTALAAPASAHGSIVDPASRNYGCWERWGDDHLNPDMEQEDPMCAQAWEDDPNAMWNWNGLYRNGVGGDHQGHVPDGTLCSGGNTESGRYDSLDAVGPWRTTPVDDDFTLHLYDQASHGADYFLVYVTEEGFDPATQALGWDDLELVETPGYHAPANDIHIDVSTTGRTGHHVVFTVWKASHMDQNYYMCSDVDFG
ncbi:lytic polysaccharide monooxygenase [Nocardiopsis sp. NRRL B-16309]|uniref:lytic polysaccharide monooxygenase auxiliary activity family 9 protein n=1 Tax=Nocardiopsis sp. NRRL B-16309 TaxID=1519494 RepID=UPI0006AD8CA0|nr:lytic polysaccharide monooxygenase [Nocardiopsis sp. NRRL B-16309]KOX22063.1 cellulose-binding protein [Nocardiopsis sp. NRRL B-16309]